MNIIKLENYSEEYKKLLQKYKHKKNINVDKMIKEYIHNNEIHFQLTNNTLELFERNKYASTYGELTMEGMKTILDNINILSLKTINDIRFIDLGSGLGKLPLMVCYYFNGKKCTGIELSTERHNKAMTMYQKLPLELQKKINYINDDIFNVKLGSYLSEYNFIFISNLCFPDDINKKLDEKLKECKSGTNIICSKPINSSHLIFVNKFPVKMTWSDSSIVHHYIKI